MSFFNIGNDPMSDAVRFLCKFIASRCTDDDMYSEAAQSLIKTQVVFEPISSVDTLVDLVAHHTGLVDQEELKRALEKEMLKWLAQKLAQLIDNDDKVETFLNAVAGSCQDAEGFRRAVRVTFRAGAEEQQPVPVGVKQETDTPVTPVAQKASVHLPGISNLPLTTEATPQGSIRTSPPPVFLTSTLPINGELFVPRSGRATSSLAVESVTNTTAIATAAVPHGLGQDTPEIPAAQLRKLLDSAVKRGLPNPIQLTGDGISHRQTAIESSPGAHARLHLAPPTPISLATVLSTGTLSESRTPVSVAATPQDEQITHRPVVNNDPLERNANPTAISKVTSPALTSGTSNIQPATPSSRTSGPDYSGNIEHTRHTDKPSHGLGIKRHRVSGGPDLASPQKRRRASNWYEDYPAGHGKDGQQPTRAGSRNSQSLFVSKEPSPAQAQPGSQRITSFDLSAAPRAPKLTRSLTDVARNGKDGQGASLVNPVSRSNCPEWCLCRKRRTDGTTPTVDRDMQRYYNTSMQPIAELMVAKLGFVFHHNGLEWSRNAIVHLRNRARTMPCHRLVSRVVRGKQAFNLSLEDDRQLERHLATVLTDKQRSMQDRRKAINSILLRFVSVNKVLFPEFEQCEFPRSYSPA